MPPAVVLVTGVSRQLGGRLAGLLAADPTIDRVIGVDTRAAAAGRSRPCWAHRVRPRRHPQPADRQGDRDRRGRHRRAHEHHRDCPRGAGGRASMKEMNVIGTMQLLAACQKAATVRRLVVKSSTAVYGSSLPRPGAVHRGDRAEGAAPLRLREGRGRGRGLRARLRPPPAGRRGRPCCGSPTSSARGATARWCATCALPVVPTVLGFDPRVQLLHDDDALEVLRRATRVRPRRHLQRRRRRGAAAVPADPPGRPGAGAGARAGRAAGRPGGAASRAGRLLPRAGAVPRVRPGRRHHPAAGGVRLHAALHHRGGVRRLRPGPGAARRWCSRPRSSGWSAALLDAVHLAAATARPGGGHG